MENQTTKVINGRINFTDYLLGLGYRFGKQKVKGFCLLQGGMSTYTFLYFRGLGSSFSVQDIKSKTPVVQTTTDMKFYLAKNVAITLEAASTIHTSKSIFWDAGFVTFGASVGLTAMLFLVRICACTKHPKWWEELHLQELRSAISIKVRDSQNINTPFQHLI